MYYSSRAEKQLPLKKGRHIETEYERGYANLNIDQWLDYFHLVAIARTCHFNSSYTGTWIIWGEQVPKTCWNRGPHFVTCNYICQWNWVVHTKGLGPRELNIYRNHLFFFIKSWSFCSKHYGRIRQRSIRDRKITIQNINNRPVLSVSSPMGDGEKRE